MFENKPWRQLVCRGEAASLQLWSRSHCRHLPLPHSLFSPHFIHQLNISLILLTSKLLNHARTITRTGKYYVFPRSCLVLCFRLAALVVTDSHQPLLPVPLMTLRQVQAKKLGQIRKNQAPFRCELISLKWTQLGLRFPSMETISYESNQTAPDFPWPQAFLQGFFELCGLKIDHLAAVVPAPALRGGRQRGGRNENYRVRFRG